MVPGRRCDNTGERGAKWTHYRGKRNYQIYRVRSASGDFRQRSQRAPQIWKQEPCLEMEVMGQQIKWGGLGERGSSSSDWFLSRCRSVSQRLLPSDRGGGGGGGNGDGSGSPTLRQNLQRLVSRVITPKSVPDFTIPRSYTTATTTNSVAAPHAASAPPAPSADSRASSTIYGEGEEADPQGRGINNRMERAVSNPPSAVLRKERGASGEKWSQSEPASPVHAASAVGSSSSSSSAMFRRSHTISYEMIDENRETTTNADPLSLAAMSLPHLKTKTNFGFETLSECPRTTRKESLFQEGRYGLGASRAWKLASAAAAVASSRAGHLQSQRSASSEEVPGEGVGDDCLKHQRRAHSKRRNVASQVAPLGVTLSPQDSTESVGSGHSSASTPSLDRRGIPAVGSAGGRLRSLAERRRNFGSVRPATVSEGDLESLHEGLEPNGKAEAEIDVACRRRISGAADLGINEEDMLKLWRLSALTSTVGAPAPWCERDESDLTSLLVPRAETNGRLSFSLEYSQSDRQLTVHLREGLSLTGGQRTTEPLNSFVKLYLHPRGKQQHASSVVKHSDDPVFDEVFTFSDLGREQLSEQRLRLKVLSKQYLLRRSETIGELEVNLASLGKQPRQELLVDLETEQIPQELGRLEVKVRFRANSEKLDVTVLNFKDLPRHNISGPPDSYAHLELRQPGRPSIHRQSKVKKKTTAAAVNETFTFDMSPRVEDLRYTSLAITFYDRSMLRSDRLIGDVQLGFSATEKSEFEHWNRMLSAPGHEVTMWHMLMEEA